MRNYKKIDAWLLASDLVVEIYQVTGYFPREERFGLISQIRRAVISVLANIAEGASRNHKKQYLEFLYVAKGSLSEAEALLEVSFRLTFLKTIQFNKLAFLVQKTAKCLFGLIRAVEKEVHSPWSQVPGPINKEEQYA